MKRVIIVVLLSTCLFGQPIYFKKPSISLEYETVAILICSKAEFDSLDIAERKYVIMTVGIYIELWDEYCQECNSDTIRATAFEGEYIVNHNTYREMVSGQQLSERGYEFKYRWIITTEPIFKYEYIFLKKPTRQGFMEFIRRRIEQ